MQAVKNTISENIGGVGHKLASGQNAFNLDTDTPSLEGRVAVITGGSEGIGYGASHTFLKHGLSKLFCLSVNEEHINNAKRLLSDDLGSDVIDKIHWIQCECVRPVPAPCHGLTGTSLADWKRVADAAEEIKRSTDRLDILFNK